MNLGIRLRIKDEIDERKANVKSFAVVDVETTGFGKNDRIIEIAIIIVEAGKIVQEWETLINPERDISNSHIHGLTATDVSLAPIFAEVVDEIASLVNGRVLVAHNLVFDARMLRQEFERTSHVAEFGSGYCTLRATKLSLARACEAYEVTNEDAHRALTDTRATAELLVKLGPDDKDLVVAKVEVVRMTSPTRVLCREEPLGNDELAGMQTVRKPIPDFDSAGYASSQLSYAEALYLVMSDFTITESETDYLGEWAQAVGVSEEEQVEVHQDYLDQLVIAANRDNFISPREQLLIEKAAKALRIRPPLFTPAHADTVQLIVGLRVCFTGSATDFQGKTISKEELAVLAIAKGLVPVASVTKKTCELVVAADEASMSGKAQKARKYGIRLISVKAFLEM
jgi:DNA polymerase-3 subunit epsilon